MSRLLLALAALATLTLATGCCCGGGYGACRPSPCGPCGMSAAPAYGAAYTPVAASTCASCQAY